MGAPWDINSATVRIHTITVAHACGFYLLGLYCDFVHDVSGLLKLSEKS
jgi:hypothetical protein